MLYLIANNLIIVSFGVIVFFSFVVAPITFITLDIENAGKFGENVYSLKDNRKIKFFYQGPENDWKKNLDENMIKKMNEYYQNDLKFFRYEN